MPINDINKQPFGTLLGYAPGGVAMYSSDYNQANKQEYPDYNSYRSYINNEFMGFKWQCVEFARRFLYLNYGTVFSDVGMAHEIFSLRFLRHISDEALLPLQAFANGSKKAPEVGAILVWDDGGIFARTGHAAIITEVLSDRIRIAEQNVTDSLLPEGQSWSRELIMTVSPSGHILYDTFEGTTILGWMIQTDDTTYSLPQPETSPEYLNIHTQQIKNEGQFNHDWLNEQDPIIHAFVLATGQQINHDDQYRYFCISENAQQELIRATNELHLMYLNATDKVLKDDSLLANFNIPNILWPRLRLSWQQRRYQMITGRLDFCMDERGLKVYEYNADSASCHTEAAMILNKWNEQAFYAQGRDPAENLLNTLIDCWKHSEAKPFIHIMQDNDKEENYHALFMQKAITEAGFKSRILHGLNSLYWNEQDQLIDDENNLVTCVWKTWAWETVLEQLRAESEAQQQLPCLKYRPKRMQQVRLIDVLLRPEVKVFEPLWTLIPSNKAILPVLWSLFPNHPYLLEAAFEVNDNLIQKGYAVKPIAGRRGDNIQLISSQEQILGATEGRFAMQENIYQELWCLPKVDNVYVQICTFTVGGHFGGSCLRSDPKLVIKGGSDMQALRIFANDIFSR